MDERQRLVAEYHRARLSMTELCSTYGVSRKTAYKWVARFERSGKPGLKDLPRVRHSQERMADATRERLLEVRHDHPSWGPRKLLAVLERRWPKLERPAPSTVGALLLRENLVRPQRKKVRSPPFTQPFSECREPNDLWCADHKGDFPMGDGQRCYPLTLTDAATRFILSCASCPSTKGRWARPAMERAFRDFGLPTAIRTDNGPPFAGLGAGGLSTLSVWWVKLGIRPERIEPGHPEQNGRHERMHRTMKAETTRPPEPSMYWQQRRFDQFRREFNEERPHEAIGYRAPAELYRRSRRELPKVIGSPEYPGHFEVRRVSPSGRFCLKGKHIYLSQALTHEPVGLEEVDDGCWRVWFGMLQLGLIDEGEGKLRHLGVGPPPRPKDAE